MATITAKYRSQCHVCDETIMPGQKIDYVKGQATRHATCTPVVLPTDAIHLSQGQGYAAAFFNGWAPGDVIANPHPKAHRYTKRQFTCPVCGPLTGNYCGAGPKSEGHTAALAHEQVVEEPGPGAHEPPFLVVLAAARRYYREDGMSFGVGDESGYVYTAACRAATEEESAPLRAQLADAAQRRQAAADLKAIERRIIETGEYVEGSHVLDGEHVDVGKGQDIYGGGSWFVLTPTHIWHVLNNGRDGDNWSANNVHTGGAGGIGRRVPHDADLAEQIRTLASAAWPKEGAAMERLARRAPHD